MPKHDHLHTLDIQTHYPDDLWRALNRAAGAHENQKRKNVDEWYISHSFRVMELTREVTDDVNVHIAAVLHDTVEDTDMTIEDIIAEYGETAAFIVWGVTKDDSIADWKQRSIAYLQRLEYEAPKESSTVALADKITNLTDLMRDYKKMGDAVWEKFNAGPDDQFWWFWSVYDVAKSRLGTSPLIDDLEGLLERYEKEVLEPRWQRGLRSAFEPKKDVRYDDGIW